VLPSPDLYDALRGLVEVADDGPRLDAAFAALAKVWKRGDGMPPVTR
jgi:hypothetical protein